MIWATSWEILLLPYANNKAADQPVHTHSLISAFVVRCLNSIIPVLAIAKMSRPQLVPSAEQAGLTGFLVTWLIFQIEQPWNNAVVVEDEPHLHALWHFLDCILYSGKWLFRLIVFIIKIYFIVLVKVCLRQGVVSSCAVVFGGFWLLGSPLIWVIVGHGSALLTVGARWVGAFYFSGGPHG